MHSEGLGVATGWSVKCAQCTHLQGPPRALPSRVQTKCGGEMCAAVSPHGGLSWSTELPNDWGLLHKNS